MQASHLEARQHSYEALQVSMVSSTEQLQGAVQSVLAYEQRSEAALSYIMGRWVGWPRKALRNEGLFALFQWRQSHAPSAPSWLRQAKQSQSQPPPFLAPSERTTNNLHQQPPPSTPSFLPGAAPCQTPSFT